MAFLIDILNTSWKFDGNRCDIKKNSKPSFYYSYLGAYNWYLDLLKAKVHKNIMVKPTINKTEEPSTLYAGKGNVLRDAKEP